MTNWLENWLNNCLNINTNTSSPFEVGVGQRSGSKARSLKSVRGQEPTAEALKIEEVQEVDIGR